MVPATNMADGNGHAQGHHDQHQAENQQGQDRAHWVTSVLRTACAIRWGSGPAAHAAMRMGSPARPARVIAVSAMHRRHHGRVDHPLGESPASWCRIGCSQAFRPPTPVRQASSGKRPGPAAERQSGRACAWIASRWRVAVKKSTMMLPRRNWHHGRNRAMAAPATTPVNSKSPTSVVPVVLRPIRLAQVMKVMKVMQNAGQYGAGLGPVSQECASSISCFSKRNSFTNP
jgi:hypothetical protein